MMFTRTILITGSTLITVVAGLFYTAMFIDMPAAPSTAAPTILPTNLPQPLPTKTNEPAPVWATPTPTDQVIFTPIIERGPVEELLGTDDRLPTPESTSVSEPEEEQAVPPMPDVVVLPMDEDYHSQLTETSLPNACGPTSLLMVLDYYGLEESLEVVISHHLNIPAAEGGYDPTCTQNGVCTSPDALVEVAWLVYGLKVDAHQGWTLADVQAAILDGHPVIADVNWRLVPGNFGHFVVIYGVDTTSETIFYHDPYDGSHQSASWAEFYAAWNGPIDVGDPLKPEGHRLWGMVIKAE